MAAQLLENRQRQRNARHEDKGGIAAEGIGRERDDLLDWHKHVATSSCSRRGAPLQRQAPPSPYVRAVCVLPVEAPRIGFLRPYLVTHGPGERQHRRYDAG